MTTFVDSSAPVMLYADEEGHVAIRQLDAVAIAQLPRVEVPAALWRKQRTSELSDEQATLLSATQDLLAASIQPLIAKPQPGY